MLLEIDFHIHVFYLRSVKTLDKQGIMTTACFLGICGGEKDKNGFEIKSLKLWKVSLCYHYCGENIYLHLEHLNLLKIMSMDIMCERVQGVMTSKVL